MMNKNPEIGFQIEALEAIDRLSRNEDFKIFVGDLRKAREATQDSYNNADLTKPVPVAELRGMLHSLILILQKIDTSGSKAVFLRKKRQEELSGVVKGGGVHHPISDALPPGER